MPRRLRLSVERLESRDLPSAVLLPDTALSAIRQKATANTPQWQAFKNSLDSNLNTVIPGGYQASGLGWIADYALGYEVLKTTDPTTAAKYADKAIAVIKYAAILNFRFNIISFSLFSLDAWQVWRKAV